MVETWIPWRAGVRSAVTAGLVALVALAAGGPARHPRPHLPGWVYTALAVGSSSRPSPAASGGLGMAPVFLLVAAGHAVPVILHASQSVADADD